jgi:hypothetical protein
MVQPGPFEATFYQAKTVAEPVNCCGFLATGLLDE